MNERMWRHPATRENLRLLKARRAVVVDVGQGEPAAQGRAAAPLARGHLPRDLGDCRLVELQWSGHGGHHLGDDPVAALGLQVGDQRLFQKEIA